MRDPEKHSLSLRPILVRFAADSAAITQLVTEDDEFRSLVEDYILTLNTLRKLRNQPSPNQGAITEYNSILQELEREVNINLSRWRERNV